MKKKGFTLIELLAVIVVLAIIALIATPIVMNTIKNSQKGAAERSTESYIEAVETIVAAERLNGNTLDGDYIVQIDGNLCPVSGCGENDKYKIVIEMNGNKPTSGTITISNGNAEISSKLTVGSYEVSYNPTSRKYEATEKGNTPITYANGDEVYFNVTTGTKCSSSDYTETQSNAGVKEGCMKFYAFNDDGGDTLNLLLDHNTTAKVFWNFDESNANGPKQILGQLKTDTSNWKGTNTPTNYTMDQTDQPSGANYTIDYSDYKARLITAGEIAQITGNTSWNEKTDDDTYYFDAGNSSCKSGDTSGCKYGWLYDRTSTSCTTNGCLNNSDQTTAGYWTASSRARKGFYAWSVYNYGSIEYEGINMDLVGLRPVITISKSLLG